MHVVYDEDNAAHRDAAYCGMSPGELGGVIWYGNVLRPSRPTRRCAILIAVPKMRVET